MSAARTKTTVGKSTKSTSKKTASTTKKGSSGSTSAKNATKKSTAKKTSTTKKSVNKTLSNKSTNSAKTSKKKSTAAKTVSKKTTKKKTSPKETSVKKSQPKAQQKSVAEKTLSTEKKTDDKVETTTSKQVAISKKKPSPAKKRMTKKPSLKPSIAPVVSKLKTPSLEKEKKNKQPTILFPTTNLGPDSVVSFEATEDLPPANKTSIAGGFVFYDDKVILANIPGRGWEIIGGRIDIGEDPENTFRREAEQQIGVSLAAVRMIGVVRIEHKGPEPPNCPYPFPVGYGIQFIGIADELLPFYGSQESLGRSLITYEGFREHYYGWNEYYEAVFHFAFDEYRKLKKKLKL
jgi:8-oxo-dGTP pyrophosphatase MutT (NUDIX family)